MAANHQSMFGNDSALPNFGRRTDMAPSFSGKSKGVNLPRGGCSTLNASARHGEIRKEPRGEVVEGDVAQPHLHEAFGRSAGGSVGLRLGLG